MRVLPILAALLATLGAGIAAGAEPRPLIQMGVRVDARPFAWQDRDSGSFLGFLVDLCTDAVTRAGYPFEQVPITAAERVSILSGERRDVDLLCDPTTITLARLREFSDLSRAGSEEAVPWGIAFSQIVFVANGSYMVNAGAKSGIIDRLDVPPDCVTVVPPEPETSPEGAAGTAAAAAEDTEPTYLAAGYVVGTTIGPDLRAAILDGRLALAPGQHVCPVEQSSHVDGVAAFCRGDLRYYFGDADIIEANVLDYREIEGEGACDIEVLASPISYEPYALVISGRHPAFREDFVRALYEVFHHGTADARFQGHFEGRAMSPFLETLFRINRIPAGSPSGAVAPSQAEDEADRGETAERQAVER